MYRDVFPSPALGQSTRLLLNLFNDSVFLRANLSLPVLVSEQKFPGVSSSIWVLFRVWNSKVLQCLL